ncbi:helix-turn-helix domain-containing protein [Thalassotalea fusca]
MLNFASRAMAQILWASYQKLKGESDFLKANDIPLKKAYIPINQKQELLGRIVRELGNSSLLKQGAGIRKLSEDPCIQALTYQATPQKLMMRWQRLERYIHSVHHVDAQFLSDNSVQLTHMSKDVNSPPSLHESLAVIGVIANLLRFIGASDLTISVEKTGMPVTDDYIDNLTISPTSWYINWGVFETHEIPAPMCTTVDDTQEFNFIPPDYWTDKVKDTANAIIKEDLFTPRITRVVGLLNTSERSLQRKLKECGVTFSYLVQQVRVQMAVYYLINKKMPLSEAGFLCGFTDQAHFCKQFKAIVGVSPLAYQKLVN